MLVFKFLVAALGLDGAAAFGFITYRQLISGQNNSWSTTYSPLDRSNTLILIIQIVPGADNTQVINDFKTAVTVWGSKGVAIIPRVRYGFADGSPAEQTNQDELLKDVRTWANLFASVSNTVHIPLIQAGFLGPWGEWHDCTFCSNNQVKQQIVSTLLTSGHKVAMRYPVDHKALFPDNRNVTLHNDCIFDGGPDGNDGGTFPSNDRQIWIDYTIKVAANNGYGGEGCDDAGDATYKWNNYDDLCGSNGLVPYINKFKIAYMNSGFPNDFSKLLADPSRIACANAIQAALSNWN